MLKKMLCGLVVAASAFGSFSEAEAADYVRGYYRGNGAYVRPHYRSTRDGNFYNNWSTKPNINPYTGRMGTRVTPSYHRYRSYRSYSPSHSWWSW